MKAVAILLCVLYAVNAQEVPVDPNLPTLAAVPALNQQPAEIQGTPGVQGPSERADTALANGAPANGAVEQAAGNVQANPDQGANGPAPIDSRNIQITTYKTGPAPLPLAPAAPLAAPAAPAVLVNTYQQPQPVAQVNYVQGQNYNQNQNQYAQQQAAGQQAQVMSAVDASRAEIAAVVAQGANPNHFGVQTNAHFVIAQAPNAQVPDVYTALAQLRGRQDLTIDEILNILATAVAGKDYPIYNDIPNTRFSCENVKQAGFYADTEAACQVIRRCDINGVLWSYLCPNMTLFNQITLVCDWFFNVNCNNAAAYYDYSNPRLYTQFALLDTPAPVNVNNAPRPAVGVFVQQPAQPAYVLANQPQPYPNQG